jgi:hypothetical protein
MGISVLLMGLMKLKVITSYADFELHRWGAQNNGVSCDILCGTHNNMLYGIFRLTSICGSKYELALWDHNPTVLVFGYNNTAKVCGIDDV